MNTAKICASTTVIAMLAGCDDATQTLAKPAPGHTPTTPPIACEVTAGPNKGKRGERTEDGWCEGDWGGTECRPRSKCKDVESAGGHIATQPQAPETRGIAGGRNIAIVGIRPPIGNPPVAYCLRDGDQLSVLFGNSGGIPSPPGTTVTVTFSAQGPVPTSRPMPAIPPGGTIDMAFPIPRSCFIPDCRFTIQWSNQPPVRGICIG